jgi:hypothetical protein
VCNLNAEQIGLPKGLKRKLEVNSLGFIFRNKWLSSPIWQKELGAGC